jgi:3-methylcrotonyl-CoA carboxylase alpha subunit
VKKVLIANRGEIACRIIRSCRALGLETVAVFSEADAQALHVAMADAAEPVGASPTRDSYLMQDRLLAAAARHGADAVHPGYGFLAENADFARAVEAAGLVWIGPAPETIEAMGDKERAREIARAAGVPVLPGSRRFAVGELDGLAEAADAVGYPLLVKAAGGGGGIGMRRVDAPGALDEIARATQSMAEKAFGDGTVYLERYVPVARHIEVQVFGFGDGEAVHLYERDCSLQRRFQKIIEECGAPGLPQEVRDRMTAAAVQLCRAQRYRGAGTIEFIVDAESFAFFFLEMNTRIQVEHPVTEMTTAEDLVALQLDLARGTLQSFPQDRISRQGHAIECRLYAENPARNFFPSPGPLTTFTLPAEGEDVRIDTGFREGDTITMFYDPLIAKLVCRGATRDEAIARMRTALDGAAVEGLKTNLAFLKQAMAHPEFAAGRVSTGFVETHKAALVPR